jgi:heme A synthase
VDDDHRLLVDDDLRSVLDGWDLLLRLLCLVFVRHRPGALLIVVRRLLARPLEDDRGRAAAKLALLAGPAVGTGLTNARTSWALVVAASLAAALASLLLLPLEPVLGRLCVGRVERGPLALVEGTLLLLLEGRREPKR